MESFADFIIVVYKGQAFFDVFRKNGKLIERKHISKTLDEKLEMKGIEFAILPRLEWSDRYFDIMQ